ncbi:MAG: hypothetical protein L6Q92_16740 [Phycisphaerae bacterium]|nr:hypothetical protein [Phycisphaerae bacterium]
MRLTLIASILLGTTGSAFATRDASVSGSRTMQVCDDVMWDSLGTPDTPRESTADFSDVHPREVPTGGSVSVILDTSSATVTQDELAFELGDGVWLAFDHFEDVCWEGDCGRQVLAAVGYFPTPIADEWRRLVHVRLAQRQGAPMAARRVCLSLTLSGERPAAADAIVRADPPVVDAGREPPEGGGVPPDDKDAGGADSARHQLPSVPMRAEAGESGCMVVAGAGSSLGAAPFSAAVFLCLLSCSRSARKSRRDSGRRP